MLNKRAKGSGNGHDPVTPGHLLAKAPFMESCRMAAQAGDFLGGCLCSLTMVHGGAMPFTNFYDANSVQMNECNTVSKSMPVDPVSDGQGLYHTSLTRCRSQSFCRTKI